MRNILKAPFSFLFLLTLFGCEEANHSEHDDHDHEESSSDSVHFSEQQFRSLDMKIDKIPKRNITSYIEANGLLEVPPQNEASVTTIIGANVVSIDINEGDKISKGQVLAYLSHPNLINLQTDYLQNWSQFQYLEKEYQRQKKLYSEKITSGKEFQKIEADFIALKGLVKGYEAQLSLLGLHPNKIWKGQIYERIPVISPIDGYIRLVEVKLGQYVEPQTTIFEIVNTEHIHADLMVFEKDAHKVKEGQKVHFTIDSLPQKDLEATIYAVGKAFELEPKAIHLHAEIENKQELLIPGMYIQGRIMIDDLQSQVLPEEGIVREGDKYFIFQASKEQDHSENEWVFRPIEVIIGNKDEHWTEVKLLDSLPEETQIAWNNAYYLMAEMKKGEAEHSH